MRDTALLGNGDCFVDRGRRSNVIGAKIHGAFAIECPRQRIVIGGVGAQYRPPRRLANLDIDIAIALHGNAFPVRGDRCLVRRFRQCNPVEPLSVTVGESPGDVTVAADHYRRHTRKRDTGDASCLAAFADDQLSTKPDVGYTQAQVHVVGQDRGAIRRECAAHCPVVAAGEGFVANVAGRADRRCRRFTRVDFGGGRHRGRRHRTAVECCIPFTADRFQPLENTIADAFP